MNTQAKIVAKLAEIAHYEGVLDRYQSGRWLDQGRRHMAELRAELVQLQDDDVVDRLFESL